MSQNAAPAAGDTLFATDDLYPGTSSHHAKNWTASSLLFCTVTKVVSSTDIPADCLGVIAFGGSTIVSHSTQNLGSTAASSVYPITGGTGRYLGAKGSVKTTSIGNTNTSNGVITIKG